MRPTGTCLLIGALVAVLAACGGGSAPRSMPGLDRPDSFAAPDITWAQGMSLHYGSVDYALPGRIVGGLWRTSYGFVVTLHARGQAGSGGQLYFFDGRRLTPLEGDPVGVAVSPDGRYVGWMDYDGPRRPIGRLAEVVVMDARTGQEVLRNHEDMGGPTDDLTDLYEDAGQGFRGFDDHYAYWQSAEGGSTGKRAAIGVWKTEPAPPLAADGPKPSGRPYDRLSGIASGVDDDGTLSANGEGLLGLASPAGRWCLTTGEPGRLPAVDCRTARRVTPGYPERRNYFAGWTGPNTYAVVSAPREVLPEDNGAGPTPGEIDDCTLPSGRCTRVVRLRDVGSVVVATGADDLGG